MRVVVLVSSYHPQWGGAQNQAHKQAIELVRRGHEVEVVTWRHDPGWPQSEVIDGVRVHRVNRGRGSVVAAFRSLLAMTAALYRATRQADVVAAHMMLFAAYLAGLIGFLTRTPVVIKPAITAASAESDLGPLCGTSLQARLRRLLSIPLRYHGTAVAMTAEIERDVRQLGFRHVVRIPNGVVDTGVPDRSRLRAELYEPLRLSPDARFVAAAGRFVPWKGFDILLTAWMAVPKHGASPILLIVGSGPEQRRLEQEADSLGISSSVCFVPPSTRAADYLAAADVVAIPSDYEGMSNVLLESMVAAVPVVSTRVSGAVDLIHDGENGRLVPRRDPEALAAAIASILEDPGDMGQRGRETVLRECELGHVVGLYERVFMHKDRKSITRGC